MSQKELIKEIKELPPDKKLAIFEELSGSVLGSFVERSFSKMIEDEYEDFRMLFRDLSPKDAQAFLLIAAGLTPDQVGELLDSEPVEIQARHMKVLAVTSSYVRSYLSRLQNRSETETRTTTKNEFKDSQPEQGDNDPSDNRVGLTQRLYGILKFDGNPPDENEIKDAISDYLIRKYS